MLTYSLVCTYHILLIHSPVDGHLGESYLLATVNSAVMNTGVKTPESLPSKLSGIFLGVGLLGPMVIPDMWGFA